MAVPTTTTTLVFVARKSILHFNFITFCFFQNNDKLKNYTKEKKIVVLLSKLDCQGKIVVSLKASFRIHTFYFSIAFAKIEQLFSFVRPEFGEK